MNFIAIESPEGFPDIENKTKNRQGEENEITTNTHIDEQLLFC